MSVIGAMMPKANIGSGYVDAANLRYKKVIAGMLGQCSSRAGTGVWEVSVQRAKSHGPKGS